MLRTNYYLDKPYVSFKLDPTQIPLTPLPRPQFEIFVHSPRVEGVHLRGGSVARGGLRWSDRREDFRTEILGLMKAQMVKNALIVPVGAKGGFVVKRAGDEVVACYTTFISALLDITDTYSPAGEVSPPEGVVRHDGDDPYLVVAADKGTATFSRHRQRGRARTTASGSATRSRPAARSATTTRRWGSRRARPGCPCSATSASSASTSRPRTSPSPASAT